MPTGSQSWHDKSSPTTTRNRCPSRISRRLLRRRTVLGQLPEGLGGLGLSRGLRVVADRILQEREGPSHWGSIPWATAWRHRPSVNTPKRTTSEIFLRPLATTEHIWCQLFSGRAPDPTLPALPPRRSGTVTTGCSTARRSGPAWRTGPLGLLLPAPTPTCPKHKGLTYFVLDMHAPGVKTRPLPDDGPPSSTRST